MALVYSYLDSAPLLSQGPWLRAWQRSWQRNGWTPRLLTRRIAEQHPNFYLNSPPSLMRWLALSLQTEPGYFSSIQVINRAYPPGASPPDCSFPSFGSAVGAARASLDSLALPYGAPGWSDSGLVSFEGLPVEELYSSGVQI